MSWQIHVMQCLWLTSVSEPRRVCLFLCDWLVVAASDVHVELFTKKLSVLLFSFYFFFFPHLVALPTFSIPFHLILILQKNSEEFHFHFPVIIYLYFFVYIFLSLHSYTLTFSSKSEGKRGKKSSTTIIPKVGKGWEVSEWKPRKEIRQFNSGR